MESWAWKAFINLTFLSILRQTDLQFVVIPSIFSKKALSECCRQNLINFSLLAMNYSKLDNIFNSCHDEYKGFDISSIKYIK